MSVKEYNPIRLTEGGWVAETPKMELDKPYPIHFDGEDHLVVWTGHHLKIYEVIEENEEQDVYLCEEDDGSFTAFSKKHPGAVGQGETEEEATQDLEGAIEALEEHTISVNIGMDEILQATEEDKVKQMLLPWVEKKLQEAGLELTEEAKNVMVNMVFLVMKKSSQALMAVSDISSDAFDRELTRSMFRISANSLRDLILAEPDLYSEKDIKRPYDSSTSKIKEEEQ